MDTMTPIVLMVFALMMINERIVEIFKKVILPLLGRRLSSKGEGPIRPGIIGMFASMNRRILSESTYEAKRNQLIIILNLLMGLTLAACSWIWIGPVLAQHTKVEINPVIGSFLAGILFSFGSKFWHDVLDLLSSLKNTQRNALAGGSTGDSLSLEIDKKVIVEAIIQAERNKLYTQYGPALVELSPLLIRDPHEKCGYKYVIAAYFREKCPSGFPDFFQVPDTHYWIATKVIEGLGIPKAQCRPGSFLRNIHFGHHGSYGCLLDAKNGQRYILTCAHVIMDHEPLKHPEYPPEGQVWITGTNELLPIFDCQLGGDSGMDYALLGPVDKRYSNAIGQKESLQAGRRVSVIDEGSIVRVSLTRHSFITEQFTVLKQHHIPRQEVLFSNGTVHTLNDLLRLEKISIEGDSGAMIYDHNHQVIGMIVASDLAFTYALKIESILTQLGGAYEIVPC